jgi:hypothetical protein
MTALAYARNTGESKMVKRQKYKKKPKPVERGTWQWCFPEKAKETIPSELEERRKALETMRSEWEERKKANPILAEAHDHSFINREEISKSALCGCYYCRKTFPTEAIRYWYDNPKHSPDAGAEVLGMTAACPFCAYDTVLGDQCGYELSEAFLKDMYEFWFGDNGRELILLVPATKRESSPGSPKAVLSVSLAGHIFSRSNSSDAGGHS